MTIAATASRKLQPSATHPLGPDSAGIRLTGPAFDSADFVAGWRYELIEGVLVVSPIPAEEERSPNDFLGHLLWQYREAHPQGSAMNHTLTEHTVVTKSNRRRSDRVIWAGLGRPPKRKERPTIIAEFVSPGKRNWIRDYEHKRDEFLEVRIREYWVFDRFKRTMNVFTKQGGRTRKRVIKENEIYTTPLLPGFELPLARLLELCDLWAGAEEEEE